MLTKYLVNLFKPETSNVVVVSTPVKVKVNEKKKNYTMNFLEKSILNFFFLNQDVEQGFNGHGFKLKVKNLDSIIE